MKTLVTICLLLAGQLAIGQTTNRTRFYILNMKGTMRVKFQTVLNANKPILINNRTYALIETDADSLNMPVADGMQRLPFDVGKTYYLTLQIDYFGSVVVSEVSERVFWLTVNVNNTNKSTAYFLSKDGAVVQTK